MDSMAEIKQTFFQECEDLLSEMEAGLLDMDAGETDSETVNAVFRAVHSIKGGAGAFGLDDLVAFAHSFETTLDAVRSDNLEAGPDVMKVLLRSADVLADLVRAARDEEEHDAARCEALIGELSALIGVEPAAADDADGEAGGGDIDFTPLPIDIDLDLGDGDDGGDWDDEDGDQVFVITFRPLPSLYSTGNEAALLLRNLAAMGEAEIECDASDLPELDELDPEGAFLAWTITLRSDCDEADIREVFDFVESECDLEIEVRSAAESEDADDHNGDDDPDGDEDGDADKAEAAETGAPGEEEPLEEPLEASSQDMSDGTPAAVPADIQAPESPAGGAAMEQAANDSALKEDPKAAARGRGGAGRDAAADATIRVNLGRVDRLVNLVGELVINQAMLTQGVYEAGLERGDAIESGLEELKQLTREIQESVMAIRAQPVKALFQRMSRIVREAGEATNKSVRLVMEGEATEVDKTVIERLADPLTHMIRNAVDHGLESQEARVEAGKTPQGTVSLTAAHRSGRVVIEVSDDGAGINRQRVKQKAAENGLISPDDPLTDSEIDNLLFMPGFSTAAEVSQLSGRGVGMDVVKRAIQAVGGKISISSQPGKGSTFTISLPLTLAILDGMVVEVADQTLVIPLTAITETLKPQPDDLHDLGSDGRVMSIRGEFIPLIDIGVSMGYRSEPADPLKGVALSVETESGGRAALIVDMIQDQRQVVIKSLEENYGNVSSVAAATILGDGRIALILDIEAILSRNGGARAYYETKLAATG